MSWKWICMQVVCRLFLHAWVHSEKGYKNNTPEVLLLQTVPFFKNSNPFPPGKPSARSPRVLPGGWSLGYQNSTPRDITDSQIGSNAIISGLLQISGHWCTRVLHTWAPENCFPTLCTHGQKNEEVRYIKLSKIATLNFSMGFKIMAPFTVCAGYCSIQCIFMQD